MLTGALQVGRYAEVARRYQIHDTLVGRWVRIYRRHGPQGFERRPGSTRNGSVVQELERENERLKRLLGEKELEITILRDLVKKTP